MSNPMIAATSKIIRKPCASGLALGLLILPWLLFFYCGNLPAAELPATPVAAGITTNATPGYNVQAYVIEGRALLSTNLLAPLFARHTGTNVSLEEIVRAASDLQMEYRNQGYLMMNIIIAPKRIANGMVTLDVFPGAVAQVVVAGKRYLV